MKYIYRFLPLLALAFAACDDDDVTYVMGDPVADDCMGVYFDANNDVDYILEPGADATVTLKIHRKLTNNEADVPLTLTSTVEGISCPSSVHFDAGSADAEIVLDFNSMPTKQMASFSINLPQEYVNPYLLQYYNYESTVLLSAWESANTDGSPVKFYFTADNPMSALFDNPVSYMFEPIECDMKVLPGTGKILISNFLGSGLDINLECTPCEVSGYVGYYRISPLDNYYYFTEAYENEEYAETYYNAWFVYDDEGNDYAYLHLTALDGTEVALESPYIYRNNSSYERSYIRPKGMEFQAMPVSFNAGLIDFGFYGAGDYTTEALYCYAFFTWDGESSL